MPDTFGQTWRGVRAECPMAPALLCQQWTKEAFRYAWTARKWSFARQEGEIIIGNQKLGTVNVTQGLATVTLGTLAATSADVGRQFRVINPGVSNPIYTVIAVAGGTLTIDRVFGPSSQIGATAQVLDAYIRMPTDFDSFIAILDRINNWPLRFWVTEEELNAWDSRRFATGTPYALVSRRLTSSIAALNGQTEFELWPYATTARTYVTYYYKRPPDLADTTTFEGVLAQRGDVLRRGALSWAARWPGTEDRKNPYFNLQLASANDEWFREELARLEVRDEDVYPTWLERVKWINRRNTAPIDAKFMQAHDWPIEWGDGALWR